MDTKYCITAVNKLTGVREQVSGVYPDKAQALKAHRKMMRPSTENKAYLKPKVEAYQLPLF